MNETNPTSSPPPLDPLQGFALGWIRYAEFQGRSSRMEFWSFHISAFFIGILLSFIFVIPGVIFFLAALIPSILVWIRRLHDIGRSGWWVSWAFASAFLVLLGERCEFATLTPLVSLISTVMLIIPYIMCFADGDPETNQYGPNPKLNPTNPNHPIQTFSPEEYSAYYLSK